MNNDDFDAEIAPLVQTDGETPHARPPWHKQRLCVFGMIFAFLLAGTWGYSTSHTFRHAEATAVANYFVISGDIVNNGASQVIGNDNTASVTVTNSTKVIKGKRCEGSGNAFGAGSHGGAAQVVCCYGRDVQCCGEASAVSSLATQVLAAENSTQVEVATGCSSTRKLGATTLGENAAIANNGGLQQVGNNNVVVQDRDQASIAVDNLKVLLPQKGTRLEVAQNVAKLQQAGLIDFWRDTPISGGQTLFDLANDAGNHANTEILCIKGLAPDNAHCDTVHQQLLLENYVKAVQLDPSSSEAWIALHRFLMPKGAHFSVEINGTHMDVCSISQHLVELRPSSGEAWLSVGLSIVLFKKCFPLAVLGFDSGDWHALGQDFYPLVAIFKKAVHFNPDLQVAWALLVPLACQAVHSRSDTDWGHMCDLDESMLIYGERWTIKRMIAKAFTIDPHGKDSCLSWLFAGRFFDSGLDSTAIRFDDVFDDAYNLKWLPSIQKPQARGRQNWILYTNQFYEKALNLDPELAVRGGLVTDKDMVLMLCQKDAWTSLLERGAGTVHVGGKDYDRREWKQMSERFEVKSDELATISSKWQEVFDFMLRRDG